MLFSESFLSGPPLRRQFLLYLATRLLQVHRGGLVENGFRHCESMLALALLGLLVLRALLASEVASVARVASGLLGLSLFGRACAGMRLALPALLVLFVLLALLALLAFASALLYFFVLLGFVLLALLGKVRAKADQSVYRFALAWLRLSCQLRLL